MFDFAQNSLGLVFFLFALGLAPFVLMIVSSFVKLVVILSLIRNALGIQQIPPNMVINALAIILSIYVMAPVFQETYERVTAAEVNYRETEGLMEAFKVGSVPIHDFLMKHSDHSNRMFFMRTAKALWPEEHSATLTEDSLLVLIPAFTTSELASAFKIGFLLFLPFLVIDLIISNVLLALGMMMV